jgi:hypothetical protein
MELSQHNRRCFSQRIQQFLMRLLPFNYTTARLVRGPMTMSGGFGSFHPGAGSGSCGQSVFPHDGHL